MIATLCKARPAPVVPRKNRLVGRRQAAEYLGLKPQTLAVWAMTGKNLPVVKLGTGKQARAMYKLVDLDEFIARQTTPAA
ncbi:MAG TPA: helix-turn-helix domain-containing protein [Thermoguttaceae bacterium]|nr:helix-turn-helix domain-containing protein [Thermoguttaceae bacterium]